MNGIKLNGWAKVAIGVLPLLVAGIVAFVTVQTKVGRIEQDLETRASKEVVATQYQALLRELQAINERLGRLEQRGR